MEMISVFDLHCDTPRKIHAGRFEHVVPAELNKNAYLGAVFAHFIQPESRQPFDAALAMVASTCEYITRSPGLKIVTAYAELDRSKVNIVLGVEGGHIFDQDAHQIETLYKAGVRVFTITWNNSNRLARSALDDDDEGLTARGREFLQFVEPYNVIIDLSHASTRTAVDVCARYGGKIIASHSCARHFNPSFLRNISDQAIREIAGRKGAVGVNFSAYHLGGHSVLEHIEHISRTGGAEVAAIGSDFDGIDDAIYEGPAGVQRVVDETRSKGGSEAVIEGFCYKNFLRVWSGGQAALIE